jgi:hypothetical protein
VHQVEGLVDVFERHLVGDQGVALDFARHELARAVGAALIAAATGNLARLAGPEPAPPAIADVSWRDQLVAIARWGVVGLGPAVVLWLAWSLIPDAATRGLAAQFAALCFVVATFSRLSIPPAATSWAAS